MRNISDERGGIFVELTAVLAILFIFYAGTISIHAAARKRFRAIVRIRNESIQKIRGKT